jgi:hypothetical protein
MIRITRSEVLRKCIIVFDALKRVASKGNAGLEAAWGAEDEIAMDEAVAAELRQMLREMEAGESRKTEEPDVTGKMRQVKALVKENVELSKGIRKMAEWQRDIMENGVPERLDLK